MISESAPGRRCYLLQVPPEIRLSIYQLLRDSLKDGEERLVMHPIMRSAVDFALPITRVNQQIRRESIPVFYQDMVFILVIHDTCRDTITYAKTWLDTVDSAALGAMKDLEIHDYRGHYADQGRREIMIHLRSPMETLVSCFFVSDVYKRVPDSDKDVVSLKEIVGSLERVSGRSSMTKEKMVEILDLFA